jgi:hypothetical protein
MIDQTNNSSFASDEILFSGRTRRIIIMSLLTTFAVPALICFLLIFYYFIQLRKILLFKYLDHHTILCILITHFLSIISELPFSLCYLAYGYMRSIEYCTFWMYWHYMLNTTSLFLTMFASIEFYLFIFYQHFFIKHKVFFHYILLTFACLVNMSLYIYLVVFYPCSQNYQNHFTDFMCGGACFLHTIFLKKFIPIIDIILPCFILFAFNIMIIFRFINLSRRVRLLSTFTNTMSRTRHRIIQLLLISLMNLVVYLPWSIINIKKTFYNSSFDKTFVSVIQHYSPYLISCASPFLALIGLPEIRKQIKEILHTIKMVSLSNI